MLMLLSAKSTYAIRVISDMAENCDMDEYVSISTLSNRLEISKKYLESIMTLLSKNGIIDVCRGKNGGYKLNKKPEEYKLIDLIEDINKIEGIERIRLGSIEPTLITEEFLKGNPEREAILNGEKRFDAESAREIYKEMNFLPNTQWGYSPCLCGRKCDIACYKHMCQVSRKRSGEPFFGKGEL